MVRAKTICLVAILKDEERFLDEWLVYHRMIGIDHFYLYDNDLKQPLKSFLAPHNEYVTIVNYHEINDEIKPRQDAQLYAYNHALNNYIKPFEWVVFLDGDEFIVLRQHSTIKEFLLSFKNEVSVSLNWHMFGHNGFHNDPHRLITCSLNRRMFQPFADVKTITKTTAIAALQSAHYCELKFGERVDANKRPYSDEMYEGKSDVANINHYYCRSFKTWMRRAERGYINYNPTKSRSEHQRFEKEKYLDLFISIIARSYNEYVDDFMLQYRYDINERLNKLDRRQKPCIKKILNTEKETAIKTQLRLNAEFLISQSGKINNIGLFNGKAGIAVFLFHYSQIINDSYYHQFASKLLDDIADELTEESSINCSDGLTGYGIAIEHLVAESFIKINTDEFLESIDVIVNYYYLTNYYAVKDANADTHKAELEIAKYYLSRFNNPINFPYHKSEVNNRGILDLIGKMINAPSNQHHKSITFLDFLCQFYVHRENREMFKAIEQIQHEIDKIKETINSNSIKDFSPLYVAEILLKFAEKTKDESYFSTAIGILQRYENDYWQYLNKAKIATNYRFATGLRYLHLAKLLNEEVYIEKGLSLLENIIINVGNEMVLKNTNDLKKKISNSLVFSLIIGDWSERLFDLSLLFIESIP